MEICDVFVLSVSHLTRELNLALQEKWWGVAYFSLIVWVTSVYTFEKLTDLEVEARLAWKHTDF